MALPITVLPLTAQLRLVRIRFSRAAEIDGGAGPGARQVVLRTHPKGKKQQENDRETQETRVRLRHGLCTMRALARDNPR